MLSSYLFFDQQLFKLGHQLQPRNNNAIYILFIVNKLNQQLTQGLRAPLSQLP